MARFLLTELAESDLQEIKDFIAKDSIVQARRVVRELRRAMSSLSDMLGMGHVREDLTDQGVLLWTVFSYHVVYRPETSPLEVVAVLSGWRDLERVLRVRLD